MPGQVIGVFPPLSLAGLQVGDPISGADAGSWALAVNHMLGYAGLAQPVLSCVLPWGAAVPPSTAWRSRFRRRANADVLLVSIAVQDVTADGGKVAVNGVTRWTFGMREDRAGAGTTPSNALYPPWALCDLSGSGWIELTVEPTNVELHAVHAFVCPRGLLDVDGTDEGVDHLLGDPRDAITDHPQRGMRGLLESIQEAKTSCGKTHVQWFDPRGIAITSASFVGLFGTDIRWRTRPRVLGAEGSRACEFQVYAQASPALKTAEFRLTGTDGTATVTISDSLTWYPTSGPQAFAADTSGLDDLLPEARVVDATTVTIYGFSLGEV